MPAILDTRELCQGCHNLVDSKVLDSRMWHQDRGIICRRRVCPECGHRWTTYECRDKPTLTTWNALLKHKRIVGMKITEADAVQLNALPGRTTSEKLRYALGVAVQQAAE